jgi:two-component system heavy metal sensor histidine kinase CusS
VNARSLSRSLTLRLALLYALSTLLILLAMSIYMIHVIDRHFAEQDYTELRGKLELASRLVSKARSEGTTELLPRHLDDALVGHHHLALALYDNARKVYGFGAAEYPQTLLTQATTRLAATPTILFWHEGSNQYRGLALRLAADGSPGGSVLVVAVETSHHREFLDHFKVALSVVLTLASVAALALGWAVARVGLTPLRQTAQLAREITAERINTRLPADRVPPELEELACSFNAMLDRLRDSIQRLSAFAADLAHEMRTPVSNLMMETQVMLTQTRSADEYREVLASNLEEYERLARTISDLLFLAKADNGLIIPTREEVDLVGEIADLFDFYEALAEDKGLRLLCSGAARVSGDRLMLRRALSNLLANSIRYSPRGSDIRVTLAASGSSTRVMVDNPCPEMPAGNLDRLFDRFFRADPARRATGDGTGLGLAIALSIARAHGGHLTVTANAGVICFEMALPKLPRADKAHAKP